MEFGRFSFARSRSTFAFSAALLFGLGSSALAQQVPASSSTRNGVSTLPAAESISQAAIGSGSRTAGPAKAAETTASVSAEIPGQTESSLRLGQGDLLEVNVYNVPELSTKARVGTSGDVYLPLIDYVHVGDLTVEEAQNLIQKRLEDGGFVRNAHVTIFLDESPSQGVTILGEVSRPGVYPALGNRKLYDMISAAGGFTPSAGRNISIVHEQNPSTPITVNLPRNLADDLQDNIEIAPGDTITVPRAPIVYVVGEVARPAGLLIDNGSLTVLQALALTGGASHT